MSGVPPISGFPGGAPDFPISDSVYILMESVISPPGHAYRCNHLTNPDREGGDVVMAYRGYCLRERNFPSRAAQF